MDAVNWISLTFKFLQLVWSDYEELWVVFQKAQKKSDCFKNIGTMNRKKEHVRELSKLHGSIFNTSYKKLCKTNHATGSFEAILRLLKGPFEITLSLLWGSPKALSGLLEGCFKTFLRLLQGFLEAPSWLFAGSFKASCLPDRRTSWSTKEGPDRPSE